jgi:hemoglobin
VAAAQLGASSWSSWQATQGYFNNPVLPDDHQETSNRRSGLNFSIAQKKCPHEPFHATISRNLVEGKMDSIFDEIGGQTALEAAVQRFYERVTADPVLASFFQGMDLRRLKAHQVAFLGQAIGGPIRYNGTGMQRAHAHLSIEQRHFDAVAHHLAGTLQEFAVPDALIGSIMERISPLASQIVNTPSITAAGAD